ncbi:MAG: hypothetical protein IKE27_04410 [Oscillospiraceae bacterium]|nr:hypothetical protein [Oscillospiraceae bacterium]
MKSTKYDPKLLPIPFGIYTVVFAVFLNISAYPFCTGLSFTGKLLFALLSAAILTLMYSLYARYGTAYLYIFLGICLVTAVYCSFRFSVNLCPDEEGRVLISNWIYRYGTLPTGYEYALIDPDPNLDPYHDYTSPNWGYDYAFTPYLPSILGALMMRAVSLFTKRQTALLIAARSVNIIGYAVTMIYSVKLSREISSRAWKLFVMLLIGIPQVLFLSGYLNNDLFSLMSSVMIIYYLVRCHRTDWKTGMCIGLGISVAVSMLSYYFGYGLILIATIWSVADCRASAAKIYEDPKDRTVFIIKKASVVFLTVFLLAGWYFIRNAVIYSGDVFGIRSQHHCAELYEAAGHEVYDPPTFADCNATWKYWFEITLKSLVGIFGYMDKLMDNALYVFYDMLFLAGFVLYPFSLPERIRKNSTTLPVCILALFSVVIPLFLSMHRSVTYDFEPQGRYIISALPAVAFAISSGYGHLDSLISRKRLPENSFLSVENLICPVLTVLWFLALINHILPLTVY